MAALVRLAALAVAASACAQADEPPGRSSAIATPEPLLKVPEAAAGAVPAVTPIAGSPKELSEPGHGAKVASIAMRTWIYLEPDHRSTKLGYLRAGAVVDRAAVSAGDFGCSAGWYRIHPRGFVCVGRGASLDLQHEVVLSATRGPRRGEPHPYAYTISRQPPPHLYVRLPSTAEQQHVEGRASGQETSSWALHNQRLLGDADPVIDFLAAGHDLPKPYGAEEKIRFPAHRGRAKARSAFGLSATFAWTGRRFGLTTELDLIPLDRTNIVQPSAMRGVEVKSEGVPAFVITHGAQKMRADEHGKLRGAGHAEFRSGWVLTGKNDGSPAGMLETTEGTWLAADGLRLAELREDLWGRARRGWKWIDVSIERQMLVAYEGKRPVFATLVSTGLGELGDPETTAATVQGTFFIHAKHVTATMDGDEASDASFDLRDVPYVQYFHQGFALHGAYWHDAFGRARSRGCVNLAPADAAWLFEWTDPVVPTEWHGAVNLEAGTLVYVHE